MYCTKCGKEIFYDSPVCVECVAAKKQEAAAVRSFMMPSIPPVPPVPAPQKVKPMPTRSFGKALVAGILGAFALLVAIMALITGSTDPSYALGMIVLIGTPFAVLSLMFGIQTIVVPARVENARDAASLTLGIFATVAGVCTVMVTMVLLFV